MLKRAVQVVQKLYPEKYAERAWDNVGLLVDSSPASKKSYRELEEFKVLVTIDLTKKVCEEAISKDISLIIAYHPFIFKGIKKIEPSSNPQHESMIKLIANGISVYSPHTSVDAVQGGVNDWMCSIFRPEMINETQVIQPNKENALVGCGRMLRLSKEIQIDSVIALVKQLMGISYLQVVSRDRSAPISSVAVCAGSGSGVFQSLSERVDLLITGELSHHEALHYRELGVQCIVVNHSNSERGYLKVMAEQLRSEGLSVDIAATDVDPFELA